MGKFIFLLVILILLSIYLIYIDFKNPKDIKKSLYFSLFLAYLIAETIFSRYTFIYLPIFLFHILALIGAWGNFFALVLNRTKIFYFLILPLLTTLLFFLSAIFVVEFD